MSFLNGPLFLRIEEFCRRHFYCAVVAYSAAPVTTYYVYDDSYYQNNRICNALKGCAYFLLISQTFELYEPLLALSTNKHFMKTDMIIIQNAKGSYIVARAADIVFQSVFPLVCAIPA